MDWQRVWREGVAPELPTAGLVALRQAIIEDSPRLITRATCYPAALHLDWPCEGACPVAYALWLGRGLVTVDQVTAAWAEAVFRCDQRLGEPAACRWALNAIDEAPRSWLREALLPEVEWALRERGALAVEAVA